MSQDLVPQFNTPAVNSDEFNAIVSGGDFLARFQLFGSKTDAVAEGKIPVAHYGLVKGDDIMDLGLEVDVVIITWRSKAVQIKPEFVVSHTVKSELFQKIKAMSTVKDSGCMYGPELLLWLPEAGVFAVYHMNSMTARREFKSTVCKLIGKAATFKVHLIDNKRYKWHGALALPCSAPLTVPSEDIINKEAAKFLNPETPEPEIAPEDDRAR